MQSVGLEALVWYLKCRVVWAERGKGEEYKVC